MCKCNIENFSDWYWGGITILCHIVYYTTLLILITCFIILYDDNCHCIFLNSSTNVSCAKNVSMCWVILMMQAIYASENTVRQWNSWNAYKGVNSLLRGTRKGQVAVCLCLVSCGFGMSSESSDTVGQICITVCEQCPLMAIHSDCWHWDRIISVWWLITNGLAVLVCCVFGLILTEVQTVSVSKHCLYCMIISLLSSVWTQVSMTCNPFYFWCISKWNTTRKIDLIHLGMYWIVK